MSTYNQANNQPNRHYSEEVSRSVLAGATKNLPTFGESVFSLSSLESEM